MRLLMAALIVAATALTGGAYAQDYQLRPGDVVSINVLEDPSLNVQALVRPDGRISVPLAGTIDAAGRTPEQLQAIVRRNLEADFVTTPTVTVALVSVADDADAAGPDAEIGAVGEFYVLGAVGAPGRYEIEFPVSALQALAIAGGPGTFAATQRIQIRRRQNGREVMLVFDYEAIEDGAVPIDDTMLADGDVIVVPERGLFE